MRRFGFGFLLVTVAASLLWTLPSVQAGPSENTKAASRRAVIYVMPNAVTNPGPGDNSQVVVDSSTTARNHRLRKSTRNCNAARNASPSPRT